MCKNLYYLIVVEGNYQHWDTVMECLLDDDCVTVRYKQYDIFVRQHWDVCEC